MIYFPIITTIILSFFSIARADAFAEKMSHYYGRDLSYQMYYFPQGWWGATVWVPGGCTDTVYLSDQFYGSLGNDELWKGVLAHEWAHVIQGANCVNNERNANEIALQKLSEAGEQEAFQRWCKYLGWKSCLNVTESVTEEPISKMVLSVYVEELG